MPEGPYKDPREDDIVYDDRRISRPDASVPDWASVDATYRPVPIVWFAGALLLQIIAQPVLFAIVRGALGFSPLVVVAVALLASGIIWHFAMERGMATASFGWRFATALMLAFFFAITALTALA